MIPSILARARLALLSLSLACGVRAQEPVIPEQPLNLDSTAIRGNQELPKVLYILPWQSSNGRPALELSAGLDDQRVFRRVEPAAYRRELKYRDALERMEKTED